MYSRKLVEDNLKRAGQLIKAKYKLPGSWELKPSSLGQIEEMSRHLDSLRDKRGLLTRELTKEESLWILCEATSAKLDFWHFSRHYAWIEDWESRVVRFEPNKAQRLILEEISSLEERGLAMMLMFLKARQLGITTLFQVLLAHRTFMFRNVNALTGSAEPDKSRKMVSKLEFIWEKLPWWMRPRRTAYRAGELHEYGDLNSQIQVHWGNQKQGIGRGDTATIAHLSELASFQDPESLVDASLMRAMHENPFAILALESTAEGVGNWWHRTWEANCEAGELAKLVPIFLPWFLGEDLYPTKGWLRRRPIPLDWAPSDMVIEHAQAAKAYVQQTDRLRRSLGAGWEMSREQMWFYEIEYEDHKRRRQTSIFLSEMPANPQEAFQSSNPTVFEPEVIARLVRQTQASVGLAYQLTGTEIGLSYDLGKTINKSIGLECRNGAGGLEAKFELGELFLEGWPDREPEGRLYIWEPPQRGETYGIGVDPSEGVGEDSSVIQVVKRATPWHGDEQVAEWSSSIVGPHDLWAFVFAISHYYTTKRLDGLIEWPLVVVETNIAAGDAVQTEMLKRGWPLFYQKTDMTKIGESGGRARSIAEEIGWRTTRASRPKVISLMRKMVRDSQLVVRSPWLSRELATLEYNLDKQRIEASRGNHDDRFMAMGIVMTAWYDPEKFGSVREEWREQRRQEGLLNQAVELSSGPIGGRPFSEFKVGFGPRDGRTLGGLMDRLAK